MRALTTALLAGAVACVTALRGPAALGGLDRRAVVGLGASALAAVALPPAALARPEGVNKPELLPRELLNVVDLEKWLTTAEKGRLDRLITALERDTGYRLRVLTQQYPATPGLAIVDYWKVDAKTIVLVADLGINGKARANVLNFNVGSDVPLPTVFWSRLQAKYGNQFFVKDQGKDQSILEAAGALADCLRRSEPFCTAPPQTVGEFL